MPKRGHTPLQEQLRAGVELALGDDVVARASTAPSTTAAIAPMPEAKASAASAPSSSAMASSKPCTVGLP